MELKELIIALCSTMSISGHESQSHEKVKELAGEYFDEIRTDNVGNILLVRRCGKENAARVLIDAHFDEIGMLVTGIKKGGFLSVTNVGGIDPAILQATDVVIYGKETLRGIVASTPPHLRKGDGKKLCEISDLLIDTGYSEEEISVLAPVGTPVGFVPRYTELMGESICGKSLDDKACAAAAIYALAGLDRSKLVADVYLLLSAQEETHRVGGVSPGAFAVDPDYAMVIDVNLAAVPDTSKNETVEYGKGPAITISAVCDRKLTRMVEQLCRDKEIPFTRSAAPSSTGTNTPSLNLTGRGVPTTDIGLPLKSMHTFNETVSLSDVRHLSALIREFVCSTEIKEAFAI